MAPANLEARRMFISSNKSFDQSATVAQHFDSVINARFHRMLILGMALRAMEKTLPASTAEDAARVKRPRMQFKCIWTLSKLNWRVSSITP